MPVLRRVRIRTALVAVAALLLACWIIPPFFHAGRYRKILRSNLENRLGRTVDLGPITLRVLPHPGFSVQNVLIKESPRFGSEPFARVDQVECDLRWRSLWGSRLDCSKIILIHPVLNAVRNPEGQWNVEDFFHHGGASRKGAATGAARPTKDPFDLEIDDARINFTLNAVKIPFALDGVQAGFHFDPGQGSVQFRIQGTPQRTDLSVQPPGPFLLTGEWKPKAGFDGPFHARLSTSSSLLYGWLPLILHRAPGVYGLVNGNVQLAGTIHRVAIAGQIEIDQLHLLDSLPPSSPMPLRLTFAGAWDRDQHRLQIQKAELAFSGSHLRLTGMIARASGAPHVDLVLALDRSRAEDLVALANRLSRHPTGLRASGQVDGLLTLQGPWRERRYGGLLEVRSLALRSHGVGFSSAQTKIRIDGDVARLIPAHFLVGSSIQGVASGSVALPGAPAEGRNGPFHNGRRESPSAVDGNSLAQPGGRTQLQASRYDLVFKVEEAPLHDCLRVARSLGARNLRDLDATGSATASIHLWGRAWPFSRPQLAAEGDLDSARLLVAGLTEPIRFSRFHFELNHGVFTAMPITAGMGGATFSGWLERGAAHDAPWRFEARTPHLELEQASLWFAVLGYHRPMPILDLIPGLRSLAERSTAGRNLFTALNAQGSFECPEITFHALNLKNFRAGITLSDRVARVSGATFRVGGGRGDGSAEVDFRRAPARIATQFGLSGLKLHAFAGRLPVALSGIRGALSAVGRLTTRGLTRPEMAAHLTGKVEIRLRRVTFGGFDPLASAARAAMLGSLQPENQEAGLPSLDANLLIRNENIHFGPAETTLSGAALSLEGNYRFNGVARLTLHANMTRMNRQWLNDSPQDTTLRRTATLKLTGRLKNLTVIPVVETARAHP